ncbi:AMP-binding protein, partial [Thermodesulfobacteriota bacterium]
EDSGADTIICHDFLWEKIEKIGVKLKRVISVNISDSLPAIKRLAGKTILRAVYQKMAFTSYELPGGDGFYRYRDLIKQYPPAPPKVEINPKEDPAILPYTGGTTGRPKGVIITHQGMIAADAQTHDYYPFEDGKETILGYMPFYHIGGFLWSCGIAMLRGYTQVILTTPQLDDIVNGIIGYKVTWLVGAPSLFEMLKDFPKAHKVKWKKLKWIASGADALHDATAKDWEARTGVVLENWWGSTETNAAIMTPIGKGKFGSIGIPIPGTLAAIIDPEKDEFMPVGEVGEIAVIGPQVMHGYWKNPEALKECQAVINGKAWFRSGDLGRMDEDGQFFIYDRVRDLIKYKGLRVHSKEVEDVIKNHPRVREVGVIGLHDRLVGQNIKAFVVLEADARGKIPEKEIVEYCKDKLSHYKIPKMIEFVGELPKTDVGKISRRELREMEEE